MLELVMSGGQTGADQAGLRIAKQFGIPTGGWMPSDWQTEAGPRPDFQQLYGMKRLVDGGYKERTEANVRLSDGTIRFAADFNSMGEKCTLNAIHENNKPHVDVDINNPVSIASVAQWIRQNNIRKLNIAGNKQPAKPNAKAYRITEFTEQFLTELFMELGFSKQPEQMI
jgi:hypothetical protein